MTNKLWENFQQKKMEFQFSQWKITIWQSPQEIEEEQAQVITQIQFKTTNLICSCQIKLWLFHLNYLQLIQVQVWVFCLYGEGGDSGKRVIDGKFERGKETCVFSSICWSWKNSQRSELVNILTLLSDCMTLNMTH